MSIAPAYSKADLRQARQMARTIVEHYFGSPPRRLVHRGSGMSNTVFEVEHPQGGFIVRIAPDTSRLPSYLKEQWAIMRAAEAGVPVPDVLEVGQRVVPRPYMIQRRLRGEEATHHPARLATLRELGRLARLINSIPTSGFGETFDWSANRLSRNASLREFLTDEFGWRERLAVLERHALVTARTAKAIRAAVRGLVEGRHEAALAHGDLRLKNVLVNENGDIVALLDWENCCSAVAPAWDLSVALHDLAIDAKQALLEGYGLDAAELASLAPAVKALNILHYAPWVERASEAGDETLLQGYRMRLAGDLDLYSM